MDGETAGTVARADVDSVGTRLRETLTKAGAHFLRLRNQMPTLAEFLAEFAAPLMRETAGADGDGYANIEEFLNAAEPQ